MNYLVLVPDLRKPGGVANYYKSIKNFLPANYEYFTRGTRHQATRVVNISYFFYDLARFIFKIKKSKTVVLINNSFGSSSLTRDFLFALICYWMKIKFVVFFRGWDNDFETVLLNNNNKRKIFVDSFFKAEKIIVLASDFKKFLRVLGYKGELVLETTLVEDSLVECYHEAIISQKVKQPQKTLLFLARVEESKGIYKVLEVFSRVLQKGISCNLIIAGGGSEELAAKKYVADNRIPNVQFLGFVKSLKKAEVFNRSHIYLFFSEHGEGMPNSVLEAMAMGLPIVASKIGGIKDFCSDQIGFFYQEYNLEKSVSYIVKVLRDEALYLDIATHNRGYGVEHFSAKIVVARLRSILETV